MIGETLGHYRITAKIGEGGMGVVYRATDARLGRDVAIKVLPARVANDPERLARFEREARTLASLNHPNIAAVYGVEEKALVMELVEGSSPVGPLPVQTVLAYARQIIDALEHAHEKGVVHRDLKPANIKITPDGRLKLLDFGLARAIEGGPNQTHTQISPEDSPTMTLAASLPGVIMGSAAYMSPEQARGARIDHRSDIWSFGAVLFELLTGRPAFTGETLSDTLAAVLTRDPDLAAIPDPFRALLERCFVRDARQRLGWIAEARAILNAPPPKRLATAVTRLRWLTPVLAILCVILAAALALLWLRRNTLVDSPRLHLIVQQLESFNVLGAPALEISPDGRRIVFGAAGKLWIRELDQPEPRALAGTEDAISPFWSPDSRSIAYLAPRGEIRRLNIVSGAVATIARAQTVMGGSWSPDAQTILWSERGRGLFTAPASGGEPRLVLARRAETGTIQRPQYLPEAGDQWILASVTRGGVAPSIILVNLASSEIVEIGRGLMPSYSPTGHLVYWSTGGTLELWAAPFSASQRRLTGEPFRLVERTSPPSISRNGLLVYRDAPPRQGARLSIRDRAGKRIGGIDEPADYSSIATSPDGRRAAVITGTQLNSELWIYDLEGRAKNRLAIDSEAKSCVIWSPDGAKLAFTARRGAENQLRIAASDGSTEPVTIASAPDFLCAGSWSADGQHILFHKLVADAGVDDQWYASRKPDGSGWTTQAFLATPASEGFGRFSPDGRYVAYSSTETGRNEIFVRAFPKGSGKWLISARGGVQPQWSRDGKEIYFLEGTTLMAASVISGAAFSSGEVTRLFDKGPHLAGRTNRGYDVLPNGRFVTIEGLEDPNAPAPAIHLIQNWPAVFRRAAGGGPPPLLPPN